MMIPPTFFFFYFLELYIVSDVGVAPAETFL